MNRLRFSLISALVLLLCGCREEIPQIDKEPVYKTKNVVVILVDGPRYTETWGASRRENIPVRDSLLSQGLLVEQFFNNGVTFTNPGHCALCTGVYDPLANNGSELPHYPGMFQSFIRYLNQPPYKAYVISSKEKLFVLGNTQKPGYFNVNRPYIDCGVNLNGSGGNRSDSITLYRALNIFNTKQPRLVFISFKGPDTYAHAADSIGYIAAIKQTDEYIGIIWNQLQNDPYYKDQTTLFVTNDHGRHPDGRFDGFVSHGDGCSGCRRIELFAISPDFKKNAVIETPYEQIDVPSTIAELLHFPLPYGKGKVMWDLFE
ncbi:MAG TPA: alkaline phosphatase [Fluviicola sp.]|nr:alkaline phosphatase [Fluviicola sp.]